MVKDDPSQSNMGRSNTVPEWLNSLLASVFTAGGMTALFAGYLKLISLRARVRKEERADEIDVLQGAIQELRADRDALQKEYRIAMRDWEAKFKLREVELNKLKDEHTSCLIEQERMRVRVDVLEERLAELRGDKT